MVNRIEYWIKSAIKEGIWTAKNRKPSFKRPPHFDHAGARSELKLPR